MFGDSESNSFIEELKKSKWILPISRPESDYHNQLTPEHLQYNNNWLKRVFSNPAYELTYVVPKIESTDKFVAYYDENSLEPTDYAVFKGKLDKNVIEKFISQKDKKSSDNLLPISKCVQTSNFFDYNPSIPRPFHIGKYGFLTINMGRFSNTNGNITGNLLGFLQLYNMAQKRFVSEPCHFEIATGGKVRFIKTPSDCIHFSLQYISQDICLFCNLAQSQGKELYVPFSMCLTQVFDRELRALPIDTFPQQWIQINSGINEESIFNSFSNPFISNIKIDLEVHLRIDSNIPKRPHYSWSKNRDGSFVVSSFPPSFYGPTPLIILHGLEVSFKKPPKGTHIVVKGHYMENSNQGPENTICLITSKATIYEPEFSYTACPLSNECFFIDFLRILVTKPIRDTSHLILKIYSANPNDSLSLFGSAVIPLFNEGEPVNCEQITVGIHEGDPLPKEYLKKPKSPGKTYVKVRVSFPHFLAPSSHFESLYRSDSPNIVPPQYKHVNQLFIAPQLLSVTAKLFSILDPQNAIRLLEFYRYFPYEEISSIVNQWIFNGFEPESIYYEPKEVFVDKLTSVFSVIINENYIQEKNEISKKQFLQDICGIMPLLLNMICVAVTSQKCKFGIKDLIPFLKFVPNLVVDYIVMFFESDHTNSLPKNRESLKLTPTPIFKKLDKDFLTSPAVSIIDSVSSLILALLPVLDFPILSKYIHHIIISLSLGRARIKNWTLANYLQFRFLEPLSFSRHFIANILLSSRINEISSNLSPYIPVLSSIFLALTQSFESNEPELLDLCCRFFSRACLLMEGSPTRIMNQIMISLFPLLNILSTNFDSISLRSNPKAQMTLIPVIMFILEKSPEKALEEFFKSLGSSFQSQFITFLVTIANVVISSLSIKSPTYENPCLEQTLFVELTIRIIRFLLKVSSHLESSLDQTVLLVSTLLNNYQPTSTLSYFQEFLAIFVNTYSCQRSLISWLLKLIKSLRHQIRCFATSILFLTFKSDYDHNKNVILSSVDTMDSLTAVLLSSTEAEIGVFKLFLERVSELSEQINNTTFSSLLKERMSASEVIRKCVENQKQIAYPPEDRCQILMRIADQYKPFPSMRLKWLLQIVEINEEIGNFVSAFIAQLHAVALISTVVEAKRTQTTVKDEMRQIDRTKLHLSIVQPFYQAYNLFEHGSLFVREDFDYLPSLSCETQFTLSSDAKESNALLSDFTTSFLLSAINKAIQLGNKAGLFYSMRPLHSLELRIHQLTRNAQESALSCERLGQSLGKISTNENRQVDVPLAFFLVEARLPNNDKIELNRQVYCIHSTFVEKFIPFLNSMDRFKGGKAHECLSHNCNCETKLGVCVVRLDFVSEPSESEFLHCWSKFRATFSIQEYTKLDFHSNIVDILEYETKDPHPHYRMSSEVINHKVIRKSVLSLIKEDVQNSKALLDLCAHEFEIWFPTSECNPTREQFFNGDLKRIQKVIQNVLKGSKSTYEYLKVLNEKEQAEAVQLARELRDSIQRLFSVYQRAVNDLTVKNPHDINIKMTATLINGFCSNFGLNPINEEPFIGTNPNPMAESFEFEEIKKE